MLNFTKVFSLSLLLMTLLFSHPINGKVPNYSSVGKDSVTPEMLCKFAKSVHRGFPKSSVQHISQHASMCLKLMKGVECTNFR